MALLGSSISAILLYYGEKESNSGVAGTLLATIPLWTLLVARIFAKHGFSLQTIIGTIIGFLGACIFYLPYLGGNISLVGGALLLASALGYAAGGVLIHHWFRETNMASPQRQPGIPWF